MSLTDEAPLPKEPGDSKHVITYYVNGEPETTENHELRVKEILEKGEFVPYEEWTLTRDSDHHEFTNYDEEVRISEGERFTATYKGPTPTS